MLICWNTAAAKYTKNHIYEPLHKSACQMYANDPHILNDLHCCLREQKNITREIWYRFHYSGVERYLLVNYVYVPPDMVMVHTVDLTERKLAQTALQESEDRNRILVEQASDGIFLNDAAGRFVEVNRKACEMAGYTAAELLQMRWDEIIRPKGAKHECQIQEHLEARPSVLRQIAIRHKNGQIREFELSARKLSDGRILSIARDMTERKNLQKAIFEAGEAADVQEAIEAIEQHKPDLVIVILLFPAIIPATVCLLNIFPCV